MSKRIETWPHCPFYWNFSIDDLRRVLERAPWNKLPDDKWDELNSAEARTVANILERKLDCQPKIEMSPPKLLGRG